jgi:preprotein translocase subunit SecD
MGSGLDNPFVLWFVLTATLAGLAYAGIRKELRVRATLYGAFLIACGVALWPPYDTPEKPGRIRLGLDLRGGIHLVLQVVTDDALNATVDDAVQTTRDQLQRKGIVFQSVERADALSFKVEGVEPARVKDARDLLRDYFREWDVREAGAASPPR